jgi:prolyl-tRNA synthetase
VEQVAEMLKIPAGKIVKTMLFVVDGRTVAALVRGDRELNEVKLKNLLGGQEVAMASAERVTDVTGAAVGFAGPVGLGWMKSTPISSCAPGPTGSPGRTRATRTCCTSTSAATRRCRYADLRVVTTSDSCPKCSGSLELPRGIEVGHVFKLGTKYSKAMNVTFLDETARSG